MVDTNIMSADNWALQEIEEGENEPCQSTDEVLETGWVEERKAPVTEQERQEALQSLRTFEREDYRAGFWVRHRHVNTIAASMLAIAPQDPAYRRVRWDTPDGKLHDSTAQETSHPLHEGAGSDTAAPRTLTPGRVCRGLSRLGPAGLGDRPFPRRRDRLPRLPLASPHSVTECYGYRNGANSLLPFPGGPFLCVPGQR